MRRLRTPRWLAWHAAVLVVVAGFLALGWWQVGRAAAGNMLSYGYAVQWPVFAGFVLAIWFREARRAVRAERAARAEDTTKPEPLRITARPPSRPLPPPDNEPDPALDAYNEYLAWLIANPDRRPADYRAEGRAPRPRAGRA